MKRKHLLAVVIILFVAACGGPKEPENNGSVLKRAISTDPESLDAHKARSTQAADVLRDLGEGLVSYSATGELQPGTAERWSISEDGLTYTFHLRADAKWSNGEAVTASHFVYGMTRLADPETAAFYADFLAEVSATEAPDDHTLIIELDRPTPYLLGLLTHPATFPMHPPSVEEHGAGFTRPGKLVSNGAFILDSWIPGSVVTLKKNEHYWNSASVGLDEVQHIVITQEATQLARYRAGEIHFTSSIPTDNFANIREELGEQVRIAPYLGLYYYGFNLTKPPFKDAPKIRRALSLAVDRELLVEKVIGRGEAAAYSWVPTGVNNYLPPQLSFVSLSQDERNQLARRLYKEAGYSVENPLQFELRYNTSDSQKRVAETIQSMWADTLGAEVTLINEEFQVLLANMRDGQVTQVFRAAWTGDYDDAHSFLSLLHGGSAMNMPGYSNEEYDALMERAANQPNLERRRLFLEEAERVMLADHPAIPIYFYVSKHLVSPEVEGWGDNVLDYHYSQQLSLKAAE